MEIVLGIRVLRLYPASIAVVISCRLDEVAAWEELFRDKLVVFELVIVE